MFHGKYVVIAEVQLVVQTLIIIIDVNVVDVNVTTRSKVTKEQMFKDKKPIQAKNVIDWQKEEQLKKSMVETIQ
jgi:ribosomal protein L24